MKPMVRDERGMALAVAIVSLVVVGALVAGALFIGTQEQRVGENQRRVGQSFGVAEAALVEVSNPDTWDAVAYNSMREYPMDTARPWTGWPAWQPAPGGTGEYGGNLVKLNDNLYFLDMTGSDQVSRSGALVSGGGSRQRLGMIMRVKPVSFPMQASLTTQGNVTLSGQAEVDGTDQNPTGWTDCAPADTTKAGIRTSSTGVVTANPNAVVGNPPVVKDPTVTDSTFIRFGDLLWPDLVAMANISLPAGNYSTQPSFLGGACNRADLQNWGDGMNKASACGSYFPIIYIAGHTVLNGVQGQGILLIDGDLSVQGSYQFFGITVIKGELKTAGGGNTEAHFWGMTMARNINLDTQKFSGKAELNYSKCAIIDALQKTSRVAQMRSRSWMQLY